MSTFVKLDSGFLNSSTWLDRDARDIFITALLLAVPCEFKEPVQQLSHDSLEPTGWFAPKGWYGFVRASGSSLVDRAKVDPADGMKALGRLSSPDLESRSPEHDGRRMVRVSGGWIVLNYDRYRQKDQTAAERQARYRAAHMYDTDSAQRREDAGKSCNSKKKDRSPEEAGMVLSELPDVTVVTRYNGVDTRCDGVATGGVTHVDVDVEEESKRSQIPLSPPGTKRRRTRDTSRSTICPEIDQFVVTQATLDLAGELGVDWKKHFGRMHDWSHSNGKPRIDWNATLRNFMSGSSNMYLLPKSQDQPQQHPSRSVTAQSLGLPGF